MNRECIAVEDLEMVARRPQSDPARLHLEACPRCRALLAASLDFQQAPELPESAGLRSAEDELAAFLERTTAAGGGAGRSPAASGRPGLWQSIASALRPFPVRLALFGVTVAAAFLIVRIGGELPTTPARDAVLRGAASAPFRAQVEQRGDGAWQIHWPAVAGAERYEVVLLSNDLTELGRLDAGNACVLTVGPGALPPTGLPRFVRVVALKAGDPVQSSPAQELPAR